MPTENGQPSEQDPEYLHDAHVVIEAALAEIAEPGTDTHDWATWVLDHLADAGWHLLTKTDAEKLINAYAMEQFR